MAARELSVMNQNQGKFRFGCGSGWWL